VNRSEELRSAVRLLSQAHGGQRAIAARLGVNQAAISRFLAGGALTPKLAQRIAATFPGLKPNVDAVFFAPDMQPAHSVSASFEEASA
jgi:transcriptional regulator with XRE-family HTH domain